MRRRSAFCIVLGSLLAVAAVSSIFPAHSGFAAGTPVTGLDLVILIDQSGSMWGHPEYHPEKNDRWNHRLGATKNIILRLVDNVVQTSNIHRVSVINFADKATVTLSNQIIRFDPKNPEALKQQIKEVLESQVKGEDGVNTNTPEAMALGLKELEKMAKAASKEGRRRIMLVITDGRANMPPASLAAMQKRVVRQTARLQDQQVELWVVGLNDADEYWNDGDGAFWEEQTGKGRARLAEGAATHMPSVFQDVVDEWLQVASTPIVPKGKPGFPQEGMEYFCLPYLRQIIFNVTFGRPRGEITITDPQGREVPLYSGGPLSAPGTFSRFSVDDPPWGKYLISKEPSRSYTIHVEEFPANIKRLSPGPEANLEQQTRVIFQLIGETGSPVEFLPQWPLNASVMVHSPSGSVEEIPATVRNAGRIEAAWKPTEIGEYRLKLRVLVRHQDSSYELFAKNVRPYPETVKVSRRQPLWLTFLSPDPVTGVSFLPWKKPVCRMELALVDATGNKVGDPGKLMRDPASWLTLHILDKTGAYHGEPIQLKLNPAGTFEAEVPFAFNWKQGEVWWFPGRLDVRMAMAPGCLSADYYVDSIKLPPAAETKRIDGDPLTVGPIDIRLPWWLRALGWLLLVGVPVGALAAVILCLYPNWVIRREDDRNKRVVELWIHDPYRDPDCLEGKQLAAGKRKKFNYDGKVKVEVDGQAYIARKFRVKRVYSGGRAMAQVNYVWQNQPQVVTDVLVAGNPANLRGLPEPHNLAMLLVEK